MRDMILSALCINQIQYIYETFVLIEQSWKRHHTSEEIKSCDSKLVLDFFLASFSC